MSVSKRRLILEIQGKAKTYCDLKRHLSPRTVGIISRSLPISGNAHMMGSSIIYVKTTIDSGVERPKTEFKAGDVAFLPSVGSICFFVSDVVSTRAMTPIGKVEDKSILLVAESGNILSLHENVV